ncbi:MAG: PP2C family serine/threonine-protein phosphatase [Leptolyngbyaceae bacterium]|nr:PP2C family serine/threonine-protein phosphatase [Leptolyngbyaceae bacterium]
MKWSAITRCVAGRRHQQEGMPCQDDGGHRILDSILMGAIADGAGSAAYAEVGAQLATTTLLNYLEASEQWLEKKQLSWDTLPDHRLDAVAHEFFTKAVKHLLTVLQEKAEASHTDIREFACTLIAFIATPRAVIAMQIGDGFIVVRRPNQIYQMLLLPDKGEYANQTSFVTSPDVFDTLKTHVSLGQPSFICAATDGLESVAIRQSDGSAFPPFFKPLEEFMEETDDPEHNDAYLVDFLTSERLSQRSDDDKTVLLARYA